MVVIPDDVLAAFVDLKKKKKTAIHEAEDVQEDDGNSMFAGMKKKKSKKPAEDVQVTNIEDEPESAPIDDNQADDLTAMFGKKKKKKNVADFEAQLRAEDDQEPFGEEAIDESNEEAWATSSRDYSYQEVVFLLERVFKILRQNNLDVTGDKKKYTIVPPQVLREGTKKTAFVNIIDIAKRMRRQPDHVIQFLFAELGTSGSIDGNQRLIIKGRFQQKQIETVLRRYIAEYIACKTCKSAETILTKENRLFFMQCESCGSSRSVSAIKTGFVATTKRPKQQS
ncbi:hypothetical protein HDV06_005514 [Boothiomyces sp. JEL0866]|nr:hypothetical protein HDV06_005514 [Boothiomyces sp. JEL0866]